MPHREAVWGRYQTKDLIQGGIPSRGQMMPVRSMCGKQAPIAILMASIEVLQMVERKNPKLMPAKPETYRCCNPRSFENLYTLKNCENRNPCNGPLAWDLEDSKHSDDSYGSLNEYY